MITFFAPASMCFCASSRLVKKPVDSRTTSTPRSPHGSAAGSRSASILISKSPALIVPSPPWTSSPSGPSTESYCSRCAIVFASPRSFAATISKSPPRCMWARKKLRPMRPNPLMPTRIFAMVPPYRISSESSRVPRPALSSPPQRRAGKGLRRAASGPEGKLRGRPSPPVAPRSGPSRQTGSESTGGRARTRCRRSIEASESERYIRRRSVRSQGNQAIQAPVRGRLRRRRAAFRRELAERGGRVAEP